MRTAALYLGAALAFVGLASPADAYWLRGGYYRSTDGRLVHVPYHTHHHVRGERAVCRDGTHSMSHHRRGTCSRHGGVRRWG